MSPPNLVSILMPLCNEDECVGICLERVLDASLPEGWRREIIVVDDGSTDRSVDSVQELAAGRGRGIIRLIRHGRNQGKGAAVRTALHHASGEFCIIQDAGLEYDPADAIKLLQPLLSQHADAVFGSRFLPSGTRRVLFFWHSVANRWPKASCNVSSDLNLADMETSYKAFRTTLLQSILLRSDRFGIESEMTIQLAQRRAPIYETPISYHGRTCEEGKKIGLKDAPQAVFIILRYGLGRDIYRDEGAATLDTLSVTHRFNRWMADTVCPYVATRLLEIGADIGNLTRQLFKSRQVYMATGLDAEHLARLRTSFPGRKNLEFRQCDLMNPDDIASLRKEVDTVICLNVVEQVQADSLALSNIYPTLASSGATMILEPQAMSNYGFLYKALGHFRRYSQAESRRKMETAGFRVERLVQFNRVTWPRWFLNGRILRKTSFSRVRLYAFDRLVPVWRIIDRWLPWPLVSIIEIGKKP